MPITEDQVKARILAEVGDTPQGDLARQLDLLWDGYAEKDQVAPRLRELYTMRAGIDLLLGIAQNDVDQTADSALRRGSQPAQVLLKRRQLASAEISDLEQRTSGERAGAVGLIAKTAPVPFPFPGTPSVAFPDANNSRWSGTPYAPLRGPRGYLP